MSMRTINIECEPCSGTGLYRGPAERDGFAHVCSGCKGTGERQLEYTPFTARREAADVHTVLEKNPSITVRLDGAHHALAFGGQPYADWAAGKPFPPGSEMRRFVCPLRWHGFDSWPECVGAGSAFDDCRQFPSKAACWEKWDSEQAVKAEVKA